jgi:hypothetical protein
MPKPVICGFDGLLAHTALGSLDMPKLSKSQHEDLDPEEFTARFLYNLIRKTAGRGIGEYTVDTVLVKWLMLIVLVSVSHTWTRLAH